MRRVTRTTTSAVRAIAFSTIALGVTGFGAIACGKQERSSNDTTGAASVPGVMTATPDSDLAATQQGALPAGYIAQLDRVSGNVNEISYNADGTGRWEVRTGPAHILYTLGDTAHGNYQVTTTIEQLAKPKHPEAYGVFIGGSSLEDTTTRTYTYFIVRGDGKYSVKVRRGPTTQTIQDWTSNSAIPTENGGGKAVYGITIDVDGEKANVSVNGKPVTTIQAKDAPLEGIAGVRINHNLHVMVTPIAITRSRQ